jgi:hypothetical protein
MAYDSTFTPYGLTYLVDNTDIVQILSPNNVQATSCRIVNLAVTATRIMWVTQQPNNAEPSTLSITNPALESPSVNTITLLGTSVETFTLPQNCWMLASQASVEVTPGEGL